MKSRLTVLEVCPENFAAMESLADHAMHHRMLCPMSRLLFPNGLVLAANFTFSMD
jgi:hypothetical protein